MPNNVILRAFLSVFAIFYPKSTPLLFDSPHPFYNFSRKYTLLHNYTPPVIRHRRVGVEVLQTTYGGHLCDILDTQLNAKQHIDKSILILIKMPLFFHVSPENFDCQQAYHVIVERQTRPRPD